MTAPDAPAVSPDVAAFVLAIVNAQQLTAGGDDFAEVAGLIVRAKAELGAVIAAAAVPEPEPEPELDPGQ